MKRTVNLKRTRPFDLVSVEIKSSNSRNNKSNAAAPLPPDSLETLKFMYLNATSLDNKLDEFKVVVDTYGPQIVAVSETWFKSISIVNVKGYNLYRKDRGDGRRGGGVYQSETNRMKAD